MSNHDSDLVRLRSEYWKQFGKLLQSRDRELARSMRDDGWIGRAMHFRAFSRSDVWLETIANVRPPNIGVWASLDGDEAERHFRLLEADREQIEGEVGGRIEWSGKQEGVRAIRIKCMHYQADPRHREQWPEQHDWLCNRLVGMYQAFEPRVARF